MSVLLDELIHAIQCENPEAVKQCLIKGAAVNLAEEHSERTPLHYAMHVTDKAAAFHIVLLLLRFGAFPNVPNADGDTPLMLARRHQPLGLQLMLEHYNAKPSAMTSVYSTLNHQRIH